MKHAGAHALEQLSSLIAQLRGLEGLVERRPGVFYRKGRAFLHFHEDPCGLFADLRGPADPDFVRFDVSGPDGRSSLLSAARARL
ncbi:MAG: hypothetical protein ACK4YQ_12255 [Phenylobacterium sp.]|uniref:hypothetical protein n=1 Tax=Phenylobacterium sp. TaxID=1871053 RepID=UPI003918EE80